MAHPVSDVIAAAATPMGEGALGIVRLSGAGCLDAARRFIRWQKHGPSPRLATLAKAMFDDDPIDRVVVVYHPGPASYTGEDLIEITCHGSPYVLKRLLAAAVNSGARLAEPGEFTRRAFLNGKLDLTQAQAVGALIRAKTQKAHRAALEQLDGGLSKKLGELRENIIGALAWVEAALDHPEDGIPELTAEEIRSRLDPIIERFEALGRAARSGRLALEGLRTAIVGAPNAGKSSLLNALLKKERAIVSPIPGTTRDTIEERCGLNGAQIILIDTAGIRDADSAPVEAEGIERALKETEKADVLLYVIDSSRPIEPAENDRLLKLVDSARENGQHVLIALNKCDLNQLPIRLPDDVPAIRLSALKGTNIESLERALFRLAEAGGESEAIIAELRHREAIDAAAASLRQARGAENELLSLSLREALAAVSAILGEGAPDEVLRAVFANFCVGK